MQDCALCGSSISSKGVLWIDRDTETQKTICSKCAEIIRQEELKRGGFITFEKKKGSKVRSIVIPVILLSLVVVFILLYVVLR